jgi:hypothetical protein
MTEREYLEAKLNDLHNKFPHLSIRYGIDIDIHAHLVEILPLEEYKSNRDLDNAWMHIVTEFRSVFPDKDIAFFTSDSLLCIDVAIFEKLPLYTNEKEILSNLFENVTGFNDLPNGHVMDKNRKRVLIINPVMTPKQDMNTENFSEYSYLFAA